MEVDELGAVQLTCVEDIHDEEGDGHGLHIQVLRMEQMDIPPLLVLQLLEQHNTYRQDCRERPREEQSTRCREPPQHPKELLERITPKHHPADSHQHKYKKYGSILFDN